MVNVFIGLLLGLTLLGLTAYYIFMVGKMLFLIGGIIWDSAKEISNNRVIRTKEQAVTTL